MKKKVLIISPFNPNGIGGAETFAKGLIEEAHKQFDVTVVTLPPVHAWDKKGYAHSAIMALHLVARALPKNIKSYSTIHCIGIIATAAGQMLKTISQSHAKLISTTLAIHRFNGKEKILKWIMKHVDMVFVEDEIGKFDMRMLDVPDKKIKIFTHWVDFNRFKPADNVYKDRFHVLYIGRPIKKKGKHIIQQVEKELRDQQLKIEFFYAEHVPYERLPIYYQTADVFVIPSLYDEGVARVVLEAAASGCAIISSNRGSLLEFVKPFGTVIQPTVEIFKKKIVRMYMRREVLAENKKRAYNYAQKMFSSKNAEVFLNEY